MKRLFTSDYHIGHSNILIHCNRPFSSVDEMNHTILTNHNKIATDSDVTTNLGDLAYRCPFGMVLDFLRQLNGKIRILPGNHDKILHKLWERGELKSMIKSGKLEIIGDFYPSQTIKVEEINGRIFVLSHYSLRTWPHAYRGSLHIYGHSHQNLTPDGYKSLDVGVDGHNFSPWIEAEILDFMSKIQTPFGEKSGDNENE